MGMKVGGKAGGPKSDINITPLVDVVLVLLIIFLVTMPIMMRQITIEVPRKLDEERETIAKPSEQITVELRADGNILLTVGTSEETVTLYDLAAEIRPALEKKSGKKVVFVDFDFAVKYEQAIEVMDAVRGAAPRNESGAMADVKIALIDKSAKQAAATTP
jgi:biopolymer transport protein ExbD